MKTNPTIIAARERKDDILSGRAGSPLPDAGRGEMFTRQTALRRRARSDAPHLRSFAAIVFSFLFAGTAAHAQVNSGSNGSDGAFNPTTNIVINMADHPNGIYQYTSVNISNGVTVTFVPNANNTPVVWLVQSNCVIDGTVDVAGQDGNATLGGPGGFRGASGGTGTFGQGPGGGVSSVIGGNASFGTSGTIYDPSSIGIPGPPIPPGRTYGNPFLLPLVGGSGGGGTTNFAVGGTGGGGAFMIASSVSIRVDGAIVAKGGSYGDWPSGMGSGGAIRLIANEISGGGTLDASGGFNGWSQQNQQRGGAGRIRFDAFQNNFGGSVNGAFTQGYQPIILPTAGQGVQLTVTSVGGVPVSASPTGQLSTPDAVLSTQQNNPIPIAVHCSNIPLNTQITVSVKPANSAAVSAIGLNNTGTFASSTVTVLLTMPRGGGIIYATAATGN